MSSPTTVTADGDPAGLIVSYKGEIDKATVKPETFKVDDYEIAKVFVSNTNPFNKESAEGQFSHAVVLLKDGSHVKGNDGTIEIIKTTPDISIRQVRSITKTNGKKVKAWKKAYKATEAFPVTGGLRK